MENGPDLGLFEKAPNRTETIRSSLERAFWLGSGPVQVGYYSHIGGRGFNVIETTDRYRTVPVNDGYGSWY